MGYKQFITIGRQYGSRKEIAENGRQRAVRQSSKGKRASQELEYHDEKPTMSIL